MPVRIFIPKIPSNEEEFTHFIRKHCNPSNIRISKNKDGSLFCIIILNINENSSCANDVINEINGKVVGDVVLKPRIYVDQTLLAKLSNGHVTLKENSNDIVNTTHIHGCYYFIQLYSEREANILLTSLLNDLNDDYESDKTLALNIDDILVNKLYATYYKDDRKLYRIRVIEKCNPKELKINFIDYGNDEFVYPLNIVGITDKLRQMPPMVHKCIISGVKILNFKNHDIVAREVLHQNYNAKVVKKWNDKFGMERVTEVDFLDFSTISYRNYLIIEGIAEEIKCNGALPQAQNGIKEEQASVIITHFESLDEFYVQPVDKVTDDIMVSLTSSIANLVNNLSKDLEYIGPEYMYISQFSQDGNWYRCRIIEDKFDSPDPYCIIQYIDFGNSEKKCLKSDLIPLIENSNFKVDNISKFPQCAKKCKFSDDLIYALSKAKMEKQYFHDNLVICEKAVNFHYSVDRSNNVWIVENIKMDNGKEIMSIVLQQFENTEKTDLYKLTNLENLDKIWFVQIQSIVPDIQENLNILERWSQKTKDLERVKQVVPNKIYCAMFPNGVLFRCRVLGRNIHNVMVRIIDSGTFETVPIESIYHLDETLKSIQPMAKPFKLVFNSIFAEEHQIEDKIIQVLGNSHVKLDIINDFCIRDVIIKEKSLVQCLAQLDYVQPKSSHHSTSYQCHESLLSQTNDDVDINEGIDFSLPSVEKMNEVPQEIAILNSKIKLMRKLFNIRTNNIFEKLFEIIGNCDSLTSLLDCCKEVDEFSQSIKILNGDFIRLSCNIKTKLRDFDPLIEKRTQLCEAICNLHDRLGTLVDETPLAKVELLQKDIQKMVVTINNLMEIFNISIDVCPTEFDIATIQAQITEFLTLDLCVDIRDKMEYHAKVTDDLILKYQLLLNTMYRDYDFGDELLSSCTAVVPLIDQTYDLHNALRTENAHFMKLLSEEDVVKQLNIIDVIKTFQSYLMKQSTALEMIINKTNELESLNEHSKLILNNDLEIFQKIEDNYKRIISFRSSLKHWIADMEDAEEQDERDKVEEISDKIEEVRKSLHEALKISSDIIDENVANLMLKKPELQLKNQSIFFCEKGIPVFLWDSIFFEIPHNDSFVDFFNTRFGDDVVNMKRLLLSADNYKTVLHNLTTYSYRIGSPSDSIVSLLPVSYAFLSKSEGTTLYMIFPNFAGVNLLPTNYRNNLASIVDLIKSAINQILNLWHLGFTFSDSDLEDGLFVTSNSLPQEHVYLPLPINSILNREIINQKCESIQVYFSKLGDSLQEPLNCCTGPDNVSQADVELLVSNIKNCKSVLEAEIIFEELDHFLAKNTTAEDFYEMDDQMDDCPIEVVIEYKEENECGQTSSNKTDESTESTESFAGLADKSGEISENPNETSQKEEMEDMFKEFEKSNVDEDSQEDKEISVTEQVLEIYSDIE